MQVDFLGDLEYDAMLIVSDSAAEHRYHHSCTIGTWVFQAVELLARQRESVADQRECTAERICIVPASRVTQRHLERYSGWFAVWGVRRGADEMAGMEPLADVEIFKEIHARDGLRDEYRFPSIIDGIIEGDYPFKAVCMETTCRLFMGDVDVLKSRPKNIVAISNVVCHRFL
jgi:hypothetical protein